MRTIKGNFKQGVSLKAYIRFCHTCS